MFEISKKKRKAPHDLDTVHLVSVACAVFCHFEVYGLSFFLSVETIRFYGRVILDHQRSKRICGFVEGFDKNGTS